MIADVLFLIMFVAYVVVFWPEPWFTPEDQR
jgi:hypothetical protein